MLQPTKLEFVINLKTEGAEPVGATRCPTTDVHLSHGVDDTPDGKIAFLRDKVKQHNQNWRVSLPGPGRVCCTPASGITQKFIHIEQHMEFRTPSDWIAPITDAFP